MRNALTHNTAACALAVVWLAASTGAGTAAAQSAAPAASDSVIVVEKPNYVSIPLEITVRSA
jgi:hypothetical protein